MVSRQKAATIRRVERASGALAQATLARMEERLPWFVKLSADERSWVGVVAQAGVARFVEYLRTPPEQLAEVTGNVFGAAPRELVRAVSLRQTVQLVQIAAEVFEDHVADLAGADEDWLRAAALRYTRDIAFAAAQVYAAAAEQRGAWDARLEALVVDALLLGEADADLRSRAAALGWSAATGVAVVAGRPPVGSGPEAVVDSLHRHARHATADVLASVHGDRLVAVVGGPAAPMAVAGRLTGAFGPGPIVVGPTVPDLAGAHTSAVAALAGLTAVAAWPEAPRVVSADDLLPERALAGDSTARRQLVDEVYRPLTEAGPALLETVAAYCAHGGSIERTARALFVHANTVRYRLRRAAEVTGRTPADPRHAFELQVALVLGRLAPEAADTTL